MHDYAIPELEWVRSLEGDEYPECAELAFGGQRTRKTSLGEIVFASAQ
jgi:hypothetical protein